MRVAVVALGKIGLPLAVQFADAGCEVVGVDVNQHTVDLVNAGIEPLPGEDFLQEKLSVADMYNLLEIISVENFNQRVWHKHQEQR